MVVGRIGRKALRPGILAPCSRTHSARWRWSVTGVVVLASGRARLSGYSCGTAPDLNRLRHYALASGPRGAPVAYPFAADESMRPGGKSNTSPAPARGAQRIHPVASTQRRGPGAATAAAGRDATALGRGRSRLPLSGGRTLPGWMPRPWAVVPHARRYQRRSEKRVLLALSAAASLTNHGPRPWDWGRGRFLAPP